jgi:hypothetical protein
MKRKPKSTPPNPDLIGRHVLAVDSHHGAVGIRAPGIIRGIHAGGYAVEFMISGRPVWVWSDPAWLKEEPNKP